MNDEPVQSHLIDVAREILTALAKIAVEVEPRTRGRASMDSSGVLVPGSTAEAATHLNRIRLENLKGYQQLLREPAFARVATIDNVGKKRTYYICRVAPVNIPGEDWKLASYRSPVGRLASLPVGDEHIIPAGLVEVMESAKFSPEFTYSEWDAINSYLEGYSKNEQWYGHSVVSLRVFLKDIQASGGADQSTQLLDDFLDEDKKKNLMLDGLRRSTIRKIDLRDQPILDKYQDAIFRLPLNSRLLLLGAPGTGKTTTLIRRLGQKLDLEFLDEEEKRTINSESHSSSWIMFTPTKLLQLYVKEAFNREGIPAPDTRIITWNDYRDTLARNTFGILRTAVTKSALVMTESAKSLDDGTQSNQIAWFEDFDQWQKGRFWGDLRKSAQTLRNMRKKDTPEFGKRPSKLGKRVLKVFDADSTIPQVNTFSLFVDIARDAGDMVATIRKEADEKIRRKLNLLLNRDRNFLNEMVDFLESMQAEIDDDSDDEFDDDQASNPPRVGRSAAEAAYKAAIKSHARAKAQGRSVKPSTRSGKLLEWLGERTPNKQDLFDIGKNLVLQSLLAKFTRPVRQFVDRVPARYRQFRRVRQKEQKWYRADRPADASIHPLEVDVILLAMMSATDSLLKVSSVRNYASATIEQLTALHKTQILVDEATDFSPIQLKCMGLLTKPNTRSFFACGDFNQRITRWGGRSLEEMNWAIPGIQTKNVSVAYRQSQKMHDFGRAIAVLSGASVGDGNPSEKYANNEGLAPVLATDIADIDSIADWLAQRIREIESALDELPSIAVLVNEESKVSPITEAAKNTLMNQNISVIACVNGQIIGKEDAVRVFDIQHIKGLEFEAVFFVGVDVLANKLPDLFLKYLYVGATRAATYLGMTCEKEVPRRLKELEHLFEINWQ